MSRRQQIMDTLAERLATITVDNGYQTDAGARVYVWRMYPLTAAEVPCLLAMDTECVRQVEEAVIGHTVNLLTVEITAVADGSTTWQDACQMEADLVSCLAGWYNAGGLADWVQVDKTELLMQQHEQLIGAVQVTLTVRYELETGLV